MAKQSSSKRFLLCISNDTYPASLEVRKIYQELPDARAAAEGFVRVIDESGEDYLYPTTHFVAVELPSAAVTALLAAPD